MNFTGLIFFSFLLSCCYCITFPKIFTDEMVLQASPTGAMIWGFLGENTDLVTLQSKCKNRETVETMTFHPSEVRLDYRLDTILQYISQDKGTFFRMLKYSSLLLNIQKALCVISSYIKAKQ